MWYNRREGGIIVIKQFIKKPRVYLDTSVISHLHQLDARQEWQDTTKRFWKEIEKGNYIACISDIVLDEIGKANQEKVDIMLSYLNSIDYEQVEEADDVVSLSEEYINQGIVPVKYRDDARHIAIATINNCDIIASWNFKHMVKYSTIIQVNRS